MHRGRPSARTCSPSHLPLLESVHGFKLLGVTFTALSPLRSHLLRETGISSSREVPDLSKFHFAELRAAQLDRNPEAGTAKGQSTTGNLRDGAAGSSTQSLARTYFRRLFLPPFSPLANLPFLSCFPSCFVVRTFFFDLSVLFFSPLESLSTLLRPPFNPDDESPIYFGKFCSALQVIVVYALSRFNE